MLLSLYVDSKVLQRVVDGLTISEHPESEALELHFLAMLSAFSSSSISSLGKLLSLGMSLPVLTPLAIDSALSNKRMFSALVMSVLFDLLK